MAKGGVAKLPRGLLGSRPGGKLEKGNVGEVGRAVIGYA